MILKKIVIWLNYWHFGSKLRSLILFSKPHKSQQNLSCLYHYNTTTSLLLYHYYFTTVEHEWASPRAVCGTRAEPLEGLMPGQPTIVLWWQWGEKKREGFMCSDLNHLHLLHVDTQWRLHFRLDSALGLLQENPLCRMMSRLARATHHHGKLSICPSAEWPRVSLLFRCPKQL